MIDMATVQRAYAIGGISEIAARSCARARRILRTRWIASLPHKLRVGVDLVKVRVRPETADLANWRPDWKTKIIGEMLELRGGAFLDIGANIGQTLLDYRAAERRLRYFGFEPMTKCIDQIIRLIDDNRLDDCLLIPVALSNKNSVSKLYRHRQDATDLEATLIDCLRPERHTRFDLVPCYRFDDIWSDLGFEEKIGVIKIDVEGAELMVLDGMTLTINSQRPWILCEVLDRDAAADADSHKQRNERLFDLLQSHGYKIMRLEKSHDQLRICGLTPIDGFPTRAYGTASHGECDYLFIPQDQLDASRRLVS